MRIKSCIGAIIGCSLLFVARVSGQGQEMRSLSEAIATGVQAQELGWTLEHSLIRDNELVHRWANRYERVTISITRKGSVDEATSELEAIPLTLSSGAPAQRRTDIADDALMYSRYGPTGSAVIYFRKGSMLATVSGPSEGITLRWARLVANQRP